jgi:hypothetical protein
MNLLHRIEWLRQKYKLVRVNARIAVLEEGYIGRWATPYPLQMALYHAAQDKQIIERHIARLEAK